MRLHERVLGDVLGRQAITGQRIGQAQGAPIVPFVDLAELQRKSDDYGMPIVHACVCLHDRSDAAPPRWVDKPPMEIANSQTVQMSTWPVMHDTEFPATQMSSPICSM